MVSENLNHLTNQLNQPIQLILSTRYIINNRHKREAQRYNHCEQPRADKLNNGRVLSVYPAQRTERALEPMQEME